MLGYQDVFPIHFIVSLMEEVVSSECFYLPQNKEDKNQKPQFSLYLALLCMHVQLWLLQVFADVY